MNIKTNMRRLRTAGILGAALVVSIVLLGLPDTATAQQSDPRTPVTLTVAGPADVPLGNLARIVAILRDGAGHPIVGARIVFTSPASFAGAVGEMALGEAVTDANGSVTLDEQLRIEGANQIIARYYGDETYQPAQAATVIQATGRVQIVRPSPVLQVPWLGSWTLIVVIGSVWVIYLLAILLVAGIPERQEAQPKVAPGGKR